MRKRFEQQSSITAIPLIQEFQEISSIMPQGIGAIGIYHSHPFKSEIFHSPTDDATLLSLSIQFPSCVSIVTNGKDINFYQMGKRTKTEEIVAELIEPEIPKFLLISINENLNLLINKDHLSNKSDKKDYAQVERIAGLIDAEKHISDLNEIACLMNFSMKKNNY